MRAIHHIDLWVVDVETARGEWGWLLGELGWTYDDVAWSHSDGTYLFMEHSEDQVEGPHDRLRAGVNHLALTCESRALLDRIRAESTEHGWHEMFAARYPHAGGDDHTALYLENNEGFEVELVVED